MPKNNRSKVSQEFIRAYRYEMTLEAVQLILTDAGWFKDDLANYLEVEHDYIDQLLTRRHYPVNARLMRQVKRLYKRKYGSRRWYMIAKHIKRARLLPFNQDTKRDKRDERQ